MTTELFATILMFFVTVISWIGLFVEKKRASDRENELIAAIKSVDARDFAVAVGELRTTSGDRQAEMKLQNDLAIEAEKLSNEGPPRINVS